MKRRSVLVLGSLFFFVIPCVRAADVGALQTVTYDVSDLLAGARPEDQRDPTTRPIAPDAPIGVKFHSRIESRQLLIKIIKETIDPNSWEPGRGAANSIAFDQDTLVIRQSAGNQRGIANLLQQLRGDSSERLQTMFETRRSPRFKFDKIPVAHAIQAIANAAQVPIVINWPSFERVSVTPDSPVTVDVKNAAPGRAVRALIASAAGRPLPLEIRATAREVEIACDDDSAREGVTRVYNLEALPARASGLDPEKPYTRAQALAAIVGKIQDVLHSKALREVNGKVIVTATVSIHLQITTLLDDLDATTSAALLR